MAQLEVFFSSDYLSVIRELFSLFDHSVFI